jgi:hypothetical protein
VSGKLGEVENRIGTVHQLEAVITAMRDSAAARSREARDRLDGIRAYAAAVGAAIGQALALAAESDPPPKRPRGTVAHVVIVPQPVELIPRWGWCPWLRLMTPLGAHSVGLLKIVRCSRLMRAERVNAADGRGPSRPDLGKERFLSSGQTVSDERMQAIRSSSLNGLLR